MKTFLIALAATIAIPGVAQATAFTNGSFELGAIDPGAFTTIAAGDSTSITGWAVGGNSVDYIGSYWTASNGSRSIDLAGNGPGSLTQTFDTIVGQSYRVSFDLGGNGDGPPPSKTIAVLATGGALQSYSAPGSTIPAIAYTPYTYQFTATGTSTALTFQSTGANAYGAALDNVAIAAVPEPATWGMMILGFGILGGSLRRRPTATLATA